MAIEVAFSDLDNWLQSQPANTVDTPYEITVTGLTVSDIGPSGLSGNLGNIIKSNNTKYVDLSSTVIPVGADMDGCFSSCVSLVKSPEIPSGITTLQSCFYGCLSLANAPVIPDGVTNMEYCFSFCSFVNAPIIPNSVTNMKYCFSECTFLVSAPVIPDSVTNMYSCFGNCSSLINAPVIPYGVTNMQGCFASCTSLVNAPVIPASVTNMQGCFSGCTALAYKPIIPSTVTSSAYCYTNVTTLNWKGTQSQVDYFNPNCTDDAEIQVYNNDRVTYEYSVYNIDISALSTYLAGLAPNTVTTAYKIYIRGLTSSNAGNIATYLCANLTKYVDLSYTTIPNQTNTQQLFLQCKNLVESPSLPSDVTSLYQCFAQCTSLMHAPTIPSSVTTMAFCFYKCSLLLQASSIPSGVTNIESCFYDCISLTQAPEIPNTVTNVSNAFRGTSIIEPPEIPSSVTSLYCCFADCVNLEYVPSIPSSVTNLEMAFYGCTKIQRIPPLPNSITNMNGAFQGCISLKIEHSSGSTPMGMRITQNGTELFGWAESLDKSYEGDTYAEEYAGCTLDTPTVAHIYNGQDIPQWFSYQNYIAIVQDQITGDLFVIFLVSGNSWPPPGSGVIIMPLDKIKLDNNADFCFDYTEEELPFDQYWGSSISQTPYVWYDSAHTDPITNYEEFATLTDNDVYYTENTSYKVLYGNITLQSTVGINFDYSFTLPTSVTTLNQTFKGCTSITKSISIPSGVTSMNSTFYGCTSMTEAVEVPANLQSGTETFAHCTSLTKIDAFSVPLATLKNNANFHNIFQDCQNLVQIGYKPALSQWHIFFLSFGDNTVEGIIYDAQGNETQISQTSITKNTIWMPLLTDELWFPTNGYADAEVKSIIGKMIQYKYGTFNKNVLAPDQKSFVLWKDPSSNFVSNLPTGGGGSDIEVYPTEEDIIEDLPNLNDGDIVASYGDGEGFNDAPLGAIADYYGATDPSGGKWLICDGRDTTGTTIELETHYPSLYLFLGGTNVLPDYSGGTNVKIIKATTTAEVNPLPSESVAEIESFTTSFVATKLSNLLQVDKIFATPITSTGATSSLISGKKFSDYDFIISQVSFYTNAQNNFMPIPISEVQDCITNHSTNAEWFLQGASTGGTDRRVGFTIVSDTTFKVTMINGTSGNMPRFQAFYGIKFNLS